MHVKYVNLPDIIYIYIYIYMYIYIYVCKYLLSNMEK